MPAEDPAGAAAWSARGRLFVFAVLLVTATNLLVLALAALDLPQYAPVACGLAGLAGGAWLAVGPGVAGRASRGERRRLQLALLLAGLVIGSGLVTLKTQTLALFGSTRTGVSAARAPDDRRASAYRFVAARMRPECGEEISRHDHFPSYLTPRVMPLVEPGWRPGEPVHYWAVYDLFPPSTPDTTSVGMRIVADRARYTAAAARAAARHGLIMAPQPVFVQTTDRPDSVRLDYWSWFARLLLLSAGLWGAALVALARPAAAAVAAPADCLVLGARPGALGRLCAAVAIVAGSLWAAQAGLLLLEMHRFRSLTYQYQYTLPPLLLLAAGLLLWTARRETALERDAGSITWRRRLLGRTWREVRWEAQDIERLELRVGRGPLRRTRLLVRGPRGVRRLRPAAATRDELRQAARGMARLLRVPLEETGARRRTSGAAGLRGLAARWAGFYPSR